MVERSNPSKNLYYNLPSNDLKFWKFIQEKMITPIPDIKTLGEIINFFKNLLHPKSKLLVASL